MSTELLRFRKAFKPAKLALEFLHLDFYIDLSGPKLLTKLSVSWAKPAKLATYSSPQRKLWVGRDENSRAREAGDIISNKKLARVKL